jgi:hypothetical protein
VERVTVVENWTGLQRIKVVVRRLLKPALDWNIHARHVYAVMSVHIALSSQIYRHV